MTDEEAQAAYDDLVTMIICGRHTAAKKRILCLLRCEAAIRGIAGEYMVGVEDAAELLVKTWTEAEGSAAGVRYPGPCPHCKGTGRAGQHREGA